MSTFTNKRKINFIIAIGYCFVVIVILFNYLSKSSRRTTYREGTRRAHEEQQINNELENQLNEQKRMNKEMREMLIDIQNAKNEKPSNKNEVKNNYKQSNKTVVKKATPLDINNYTIPKLDPKVEEKFKKNTLCPFNLDRNPFTSPIPVTEVSVTEESVNFPGQSVICNPILPFIFSSSNSDFQLISNY